MDTVNILDILDQIEGIVICGDNANSASIAHAFASDLMSDVLTLNTESLLLITGLANMQTIRTAEMADIKNILFVRNKKPSQDMIDLAKNEGINLFTCNKSMFSVCGKLYSSGLKPVY